MELIIYNDGFIFDDVKYLYSDGCSYETHIKYYPKRFVDLTILTKNSISEFIDIEVFEIKMIEKDLKPSKMKKELTIDGKLYRLVEEKPEFTVHLNEDIISDTLKEFLNSEEEQRLRDVVIDAMLKTKNIEEKKPLYTNSYGTEFFGEETPWYVYFRGGCFEIKECNCRTKYYNNMDYLSEDMGNSEILKDESECLKWITDNYHRVIKEK